MFTAHIDQWNNLVFERDGVKVGLLMKSSTCPDGVDLRPLVAAVNARACVYCAQAPETGCTAHTVSQEPRERTVYTIHA